MERISAKTLELAIEKASEQFNVAKEDVNYIVVEEKKGLFVKKVVIDAFQHSDVLAFVENYLRTIIENFGLSCEIEINEDSDIIKVILNTNHNSIIIGKNGRTLQSLNELVRNATNSTFKRRYRILLDVNSYKDDKYEKIIRIAKRVAKEVQKTKIAAKLDPMTSDERRVIHNALSNMPHIKTESIGQGHHRQLTITYVE